MIAGVIQQLAALVQGGDEYMGLLVFKDSTSYAGTNPGNTHMIFDGTTQNGRATLMIKRVNRAATVSGSTSVQAYTTNNWTASVSGSSGGVTYTWTIDGEIVQSGSSSVLSYHNNGSAFSVGVTAADGVGTIGSNSMYVSTWCPPQGCPY